MASFIVLFSLRPISNHKAINLPEQGPLHLRNPSISLNFINFSYQIKPTGSFQNIVALYYVQTTSDYIG